jgi:hypothetical protein
MKNSQQICRSIILVVLFFSNERLPNKDTSDVSNMSSSLLSKEKRKYLMSYFSDGRRWLNVLKTATSNTTQHPIHRPPQKVKQSLKFAQEVFFRVNCRNYVAFHLLCVIDNSRKQAVVMSEVQFFKRYLSQRRSLVGACWTVH